ncbi:MAG: ComF family protein [Clostridia bacterium]|nr:ComF family protein [Clostridia bacterium]
MFSRLLSFFDRNEYADCLACGETYKKDRFAVLGGAKGICSECQLRLPFVPVGQAFPERNNSLYSLSVFYYVPPVRELIIDYKFNGCRAYGGIFAKYMTDIARLLFYEDYGFNMLAPVPLSEERLMERGYNQAEILSSFMAEELGIAHSTRLIRKVKNTKRQSELTTLERSENLRGAFSADAGLAKGRSIILVDDVYTTGNTLRECASVLLEAGAEKVAAVTLARKGKSAKSREYYELFGM